MTSSEKLFLNPEKGKKVAEKFRKNTENKKILPATNDLLEDIPHTLLSASHIKDIVRKTGAISPFYVGGKPKSRLKMSSYEGRIGKKAYQYTKDSTAVRIFDRAKDDTLLIPKNSIVFVECDLDFRLPEFIGARFNLQIVHVHRGLLLGTGPLVDPGFWGKLCIPIHNLTDEDYEIPKDEGLIWLEFTKTTAQIEGERFGARPFGGKEFWDISEYLDKSAKQFGLHQDKPKIPIRSSLPTIFRDANRSALDAAKSVEKVRRYVGVIGSIGVIGIIVLIVEIAVFISQVISMNGDTRAVLNDLQPRLSKVEQKFDNHGNALQASVETDLEANNLLDDLLKRSDKNGETTKIIAESLKDQIGANSELQSTVLKLQKELGRLAEEIEILRQTKETILLRLN